MRAQFIHHIRHIDRRAFGSPFWPRRHQGCMLIDMPLHTARRRLVDRKAGEIALIHMRSEERVLEAEPNILDIAAVVGRNVQSIVVVEGEVH